MATVTAISDQAAAQAAVDALTHAIKLLDQAGAALPQIAFLTRSAHDSADTALMIAANELKLAQREASTRLSPAQQEALGRPCLCYPNCAAEG